MTKAGKCCCKTSGRWDRKGNLKPYCTGNWMPGWKWRNGWWKASKVRVAWFLEWGQRGVKGLPKVAKVWRGSLFRYTGKVNSELDVLVVFNWSTEGTSGVLKGQRNRVSGAASALECVPPAGWFGQGLSCCSVSHLAPLVTTAHSGRTPGWGSGEVNDTKVTRSHRPVCAADLSTSSGTRSSWAWVSILPPIPRLLRTHPESPGAFEASTLNQG